jgi:hypothetical protein
MRRKRILLASEAACVTKEEKDRIRVFSDSCQGLLSSNLNIYNSVIH